MRSHSFPFVTRTPSTTQGVQVLCWIVLPASIFHTVYTLGEITCCWRKTVDGRQRLQKQHTSDDVAKDTPPAGGCLGWVSTVCSSWLYHLSTRSPYFFYKTWLSELYEFVFQVRLERGRRGWVQSDSRKSIITTNLLTPPQPVRTLCDRSLLSKSSPGQESPDSLCAL